MSTVEKSVPPLVQGDKLTREEFLRRWETMPRLKRAELIEGIVYMPSPLSRDHAVTDVNMVTWLGYYVAHTPGCEAGSNGTWLMGEDDAPQPDTALRILPRHGGQSEDEGKYPRGAPELAAEVCLSRTSYDLHQKRELYERAGVREYVAVLVSEKEVRWYRLVGATFQRAEPDAEGVFRSQVFPGLWLDGRALLEGRLPQVLAKLAEGLATPEHAAFVTRLAVQKEGGAR